MKLIRTIDGKIGLVVLLSDGPHVIDILKSLGLFAPHDPLANGLLNGALKDGCDWSQIIKHWAYLRGPLKKLASIAKVCQDHQSLNIRPLTEQLELKGAGDQIIAIEITESPSLEERETTGRHAAERLSGGPAPNETQRDPIPPLGTAQIIDFSRHGKTGVPRP